MCMHAFIELNMRVFVRELSLNSLPMRYSLITYFKELVGSVPAALTQPFLYAQRPGSLDLGNVRMHTVGMGNTANPIQYLPPAQPNHSSMLPKPWKPER